MNFLEKMKQAGTVAADLEAAAERDADRLIARAAELDVKRAKAFEPHFKRLDASHDALDGLEHALDELGNGAPALGSGDGKTADEHPPQTDDPNLPPQSGSAYGGTSPKS